MPIGKFLYFGDFVAIPVAVALFAYLAFSAHGLYVIPEWSVALVIGLALWTFAEYVIHRWVYHHAPVFSALHDSHHREPKAMIGVPSFASSGFIILVCYAPLFFFAPVFAAGLTSGVLLGYALYMLVHHATHHWTIQPGDWLYEARMRHLSHHYYDSANFGIVTGFWDRMFGTIRARRDRLART
jgi:sterol desaturase/sphingolipid hydroxylase (fatty acid hydroxylase superfamily)